ncbi:helix-turn-helix domain-containing protein [Caballeronia arvi]
MARTGLRGSGNVTYVAIEMGYHDQGHLSREFARFFGVPPGRARR